MKKNLFFAALALVALASCTDDQFVGDITTPQDNSPSASDAIVFNSSTGAITRANEFVGATAAEKLGGMFVVEGTKGSEQTNSPSTTVVFDNYLVGYTPNTAATTESNSHNWEYVGLENGISGRMTGLPTANSTWAALHPTGTAQSQTVKFWDYSTSQYDFYAYSTGTCEAIPVPGTAAAPASGKIQVSRINQVTTEAPTGFTMRASSATDLKQCYYTDITKVPKANYNKPVTLTFRNMTAKVRLALYETVPGYSVKDVQFFQAEAADPAKPADLATNISANPATLFTTGSDKLPQSGTVTVLYPRVGTSSNSAADYNKASVTVTADASDVTTQTFGALTAQYVPAEAHEGATAKINADATLTAAQATAVNTALNLTGGDAYATDGTATISAEHATAYNATISLYLGRTLPTASFAGDAADDFYQAVIPNTDGYPLTLRVNYTLVATDGSGETIKVYGAKAVVPATYTKWLPNYAYTYVFKISDNSNGWTSTAVTGDNPDPAGLYPITFDAMVASFTDANAEQTTITTVATPSITTYQQGHDWAHKDEYSKSQKAGADATNYKDLYVQVMSTGATPTLYADLNGDNKSLLFAVTSTTGTPISEATVMDAMQNRTNLYSDPSPVGRNGITLTAQTNGAGQIIDNTVTSIINGVDDQPITKIAGTDISAGQVAKIDIDNLATGTYAYVYSITVPTSDTKVYHVIPVDNDTDAKKHYEVELSGTETPLTSGTAQAGKVYFVKNVDAEGHFVSYTFKQTKIDESVVGFVEKDIPGSLASGYHANSAGHYYFYFDVYNQNNGAYAVKVIKVTN